MHCPVTEVISSFNALVCGSAFTSFRLVMDINSVSQMMCPGQNSRQWTKATNTVIPSTEYRVQKPQIKCTSLEGRQVDAADSELEI
jgi:hypothetical protein